MTTDLARQDVPNTALANPEDATAALTHYLGTGDLSRLSGEQKAALYLDTCRSLDINPRTRPFDWIEFYDPETKSKKLTLYPNKTCSDQLAYQHRIRVRVVEEKIVGTLFKVVVEGTMPNGRTETNVSYLDLTDRDGNQLRGQRLGNLFMKGHTKAKRRLIFGMLGMMSPPDVEELQQARLVTLDGRGNVLENPTDQQRALAASPAIASAIGEATFETTAQAERSPLAGTPDQRPRVEDPEREAPPAGPAPTFRCDKARWSRVWATLPSNVLLNDQEARRRYIGSYTSTWPEAARTNSLSRLLDIITDVQAQRFMDDTREWLAERAAAEAADPDGELEGVDGLTPEQADDEAAMQRGDRARPAGVDERVHTAVQLTGGPPAPAREEDASPERLDHGRQYSRPELFELYDAWATRMKALDAIWKPDDVKRLPDQALRAAVEGLSSQVVDLEDHLRRFPDESDEGQAD